MDPATRERMNDGSTYLREDGSTYLREDGTTYLGENESWSEAIQILLYLVHPFLLSSWQIRAKTFMTIYQIQ
jgi:hypothetical protein